MNAIIQEQNMRPLIAPLRGKKLKVAIVHDWLVVVGGAEKVLEQLIDLYPEADIFTTVDFLPAEHRGMLKGCRVTPSFIQKLPFARTKYRSYLPLMPLAIEQFDLSSYDVVISSSYAVAKGVLTSPTQLHISYIHSPMRYAWDLQHQYLRESGLAKGSRSFLARSLLHYLRMWDLRTAPGVDVMLANSRFIGRRIEKAYGRTAEVIYPPVSTKEFTFQATKQDFYLTASRLVPYKMIPLIVEAFTAMPHRKLVVVGEGPDLERIRRMAGPNVQVLGYQPFEQLKKLMQDARGFVFAAEEDFGITPVEAQACGTPVIAFGKGGSLETVLGLGYHDHPTGIFFNEQTPGSIIDAVEAFEANAHRFSAVACRQHAESFSVDHFRAGVTAAVSRAVAGFCY